MVSSKTDLRSLINFRPCCVLLTGRCQLLELDCEEREGIYHPEADTCSEVRIIDEYLCVHVHKCDWVYENNHIPEELISVEYMQKAVSTSTRGEILCALGSKDTCG